MKICIGTRESAYCNATLLVFECFEFKVALVRLFLKKEMASKV